MLSRFMRLGLPLGALLTILSLWSAQANATPAFAKKEGIKDCNYCHVNPGGPRNFRGRYYKAHGLSFGDFDNIYEARLAGVADPTATGADAKATIAEYPNVKTSVPDVLKFTMKDIDGKPVNLARYQGNVIMMINVASKCGNTPQYKGLQKLYDDNKDKGFVILGFPANDFGKQEPGTEKEIKAFCTDNYKVTFPLFSKIVVKGDDKDKAPLYKFLTDPKTDPKFGKDIDWNFAKFLVNRKGEIVARFPASTKPSDPAVMSAVEDALKEPRPEAGEKTASAK
jgi:glutathione peroxidase